MPKMDDQRVNDDDPTEPDQPQSSPDEPRAAAGNTLDAPSQQTASSEPRGMAAESVARADLARPWISATESPEVAPPRSADAPHPLAAFSVSVGRQFVAPVVSDGPRISSGGAAEQGPIANLLGRHGERARIEVGPYRPSDERAAHQIERLADRNDAAPVSSRQKWPPSGEASPLDSLGIPMVAGATRDYQPAGVPLPVLLVQLDDLQSLITAELDAHSERMAAISKQQAEEVVRYHEWVRRCEERRFYRD
jgi:hypothetical protein